MRETSTAQIQLRNDGILSVHIRRGAHQSLADAEENLALALAGTAGVRRPLLVNVVGARPLDAEVRHHYSGQRLVDGFLAFALVVDASPLGRMMGNVYFLVARPGIPSRLFSDEPEAVAWLKGFLS
jgi:hypothetical protein